MSEIITLLKPRIWSIRNRRRIGGGGTSKMLLIGAIGTAVWAGIFVVSLRVLAYFESIEEIGEILALKLMSMILLTAFTLLIFSSILTHLSKLYLSRDLLLVNSLPVSSYQIFVARWIDSTFESAWMVIIYTIPVFLAYGIVNHAPFFYYILFLLIMILLSVISSTLSALVVMLAVIVIPANRMKTIFIFLGLLLFLVLYFAFRMLKPELLVDPEVFTTVLVYIKSLRTPSAPYLPSTWAYDGIRMALAGNMTESVFHIMLLLSAGGVLLFINTVLSDSIYFKGFSKTQTAQVRLIRSKSGRKPYTGRFKGPTRALAVKEIKTFLREQSQWTQLFLIAALIVIYLYNFHVLPLEKSPIQTVFLQNLLSFLNMGLALFVLTAVAARFAYPAVSMETEAFWIIKSAPIPVRTFLIIKFFIYYLPLLVLTEILIVATNILLNVTPFMMALSTITVFLLVPGIVSMGIGLGAAYPDFRAENPLQTVTSYGGILYMILCAALIGAAIVLEAGPVYHLFMAKLRGWPITTFRWIWIVLSFAMVFAISLASIILPLRFGEKRLSRNSM